MRLYKIHSFLLLMLALSCQSIVDTIPEHMVISSKYIVLDENKSANHVKCNNNTPPFLKMEESDCSFKLRNMEFDISRKFKIDKQGKIIEFWRYLPEGPLVYTLNDIVKDKGIEEEIEYQKFAVKISNDRRWIIDNIDTTEIETIFIEEKLILMKQNNKLQKKGLRIIYSYDE
jgi:hypothetical protein